MECVDWEAVSSVLTSQLLPFAMNTGTVSVFPEEGSAMAV